MNSIDWFLKRGLKVLNYQTDTIIKVKDSMNKQPITVLAACPSAGKTKMTIHILDDYLEQNPSHKVLILAHGTMLLRTQFHDVLIETKPDFTYNLVESFNEYDETKQINVCLPQTLKSKNLPKIDLLIVDEAHQFYFGDKMVKEIIEKTKPTKQLLLTGTPSIFIRNNFPIIPVTLNTVFDEDMISDVYVEIATSSYNFDIYDYNQNDELKTSISIKNLDTKNTLDNLINKIVERLKSIKGNEYINLLPEWLPTLQRLKKTMIVCKSQHQAQQVKNYFDNINIKSALSISDTDHDSKEIDYFTTQSDVLILIVVGRGILGFNYPELVNVVDMTTSKNVDRIFQLFCRVLRKHPKGEKKLFFKISPNTMSDYFKYIMTGVLSLSDEYYYTHFNGKNFDDIQIPIIKTKTDHSPNSSPHISKKKNNFRPLDFSNLPIFELFKDILHKKNALLQVYAYTSIYNVRSEFMRTKAPSMFWTKEMCIESALKYKTRLLWHTNEQSAYQIARKNNWMDECTEHMDEMQKPKGYWTKENCIKHALKYNSIKEWRKNVKSSIKFIKKNGWMDECTAHMLDTKEKIIKENKKQCLETALRYQTISEWIKNNSRTYALAYAHKWMDECTEHMNKISSTPHNYWTKERCIENALKYKTITEWRKNEKKCHAAAVTKEWYNECLAHMIKKGGKYWTKERCFEDVSKYETIELWKINNYEAYYMAYTKKWIIECYNFIKNPITKEKCVEIALKYKRRIYFRINEPDIYIIAKRNKWLIECCAHMDYKHVNKSTHWTKEMCIEIAKKYNRRSDWQKNDGPSYQFARLKVWYKECTAHMINTKK